MPRLNDATMESLSIGGSNFTFSGTRIERLEAAEYTLVTIAVDATGSVHGFEKELRDMIVTSVDACRKDPRSDNMLVRVVLFGSQFAGGVDELHGFKPLAEITSSDYGPIVPGGMTPLNDACFSAIGASNAYAEQLVEDDFGVNAIVIVITDGGENASTATMRMVKEEAAKAVTGEVLESMVSVLVGVNTAACQDDLNRFQNDAGMTQYVDAGDATPARLAKLAGFVSQSISSQSQALGTGGPSQAIAATI